MSKNNINKFNFKVINFKNDNNVPIFKENRNKKWIDYGSKNNYPDYLLDIFHNRSNKHKAIINRKSKMVAGNGFLDLPNASKEYTDFISNIYSKKTMEDIASKIAFDLEIYGGFALKIKWSRDRSKIASIDYFDYRKVRLSAEGDDKLFISKDWSNVRKNDNTPVEVSRFSQLTKEEEPIQIYLYIEDQPGMEYYPIPAYSSTLTWIDADWEISNFHLSSIKNGFSAGFVLNFSTGIPSEEEMDIAYREFEKKYSGSTNAGKFILTFSDGKDGAPELLPIELNGTDDRYLLLANQIKEEIFIGHEVVSPMLFGVRTEGQLGGRAELIDAMELFQTTYIDYQQRKIEKVLNSFSKINGVKEEIKLNNYTLFKN